MKHQEGHFTNALGQSIFYQRWQPETPPKAVLQLVHGLNEHSGRYADFAADLVSHGFAVCALDLPSHGKSAGQPGHIDHFSDHINTVMLYRDMVEQEFPETDIFLFGHSMGGLISSNVLLDYQSRFKGCILSGAALRSPLQPAPIQMFIIKLLSRLLPKTGMLQLAADGVSRDPKVVENYINDPLNYGGKVSARAVRELFGAMHRVEENMAAISLPLLILHGEADSMAAADGARLLNDKCSSVDKTLHIYPELYHEILNEPEKEQVYKHISDWLIDHCEAASNEVEK